MSKTPPDELHSKQEILEVIYRRARAADRRDIELARSCYHPDATEDHEGFQGSAEEFLRQSQISDSSAVKVMYHFVGNVLIELRDDVALVESYVTVQAVVELTETRDVSIAARYLDRFTWRDGRWAIQHRQLVFETSRVEPAAPRYWDVMGIDVETLPFGTDGPDDPLYTLLS